MYLLATVPPEVSSKLDEIVKTKTYNQSQS